MGFFHVAKEVVVIPIKPKKPCAYPDCPNLTHDTYCEEHQALRHKQYDKYSHAPNHDKKYGTTVEEIHHIVLLSRGETNQFSNLMSLCQICHMRIHYELGDRKK